MPTIVLQLDISNDLGVKSVIIDYNDTGLPDDSNLIRKVAITLLKCLDQNEDSIKTADMLNELGIPVQESKKGK